MSTPPSEPPRSWLGQDARAAKLRRQAERMQERFDAAFWCEDLGTYALALDVAKRPCTVRTSNAGHCLFTGIALEERAALLAGQLLSPEMFSRWGVRTLAETEVRYNPMPHHNGSVWPHDNAIIAAGLARYGFRDEALRILAGLSDASTLMDLHRLPELFCGFSRRPGKGPTLYPVACAPQAWAAAAPFMLLEAVLGLTVQGDCGRLVLQRPTLPAFLEQVTFLGLAVGRARVDLTLHRHPDDVGVNVLQRQGNVEVVVVK